MIFMFEEAIRNMTPPVERLVILVDFKDFGVSNLDYSFLKMGISALQSYYPERLGKLVLLNPPFIFKTVWPVIKPWLHPNTANRVGSNSSHCFSYRCQVQFLESNYQTELLQFIDSECLQTKYGGTSTFEYDPAGGQNILGLLDNPTRK